MKSFWSHIVRTFASICPQSVSLISRIFSQKISEMFWHSCLQRFIWPMYKSQKLFFFICGNPMSESINTWKISTNPKKNMNFSLAFPTLCFLHSNSFHIHFFVGSSTFSNFPSWCVIWEPNHRTCDCQSSTLTTRPQMQLAAAYISCFIDFLCSCDLQKLCEKIQNHFYFSCKTLEF